MTNATEEQIMKMSKIVNDYIDKNGVKDDCFYIRVTSLENPNGFVWQYGAGIYDWNTHRNRVEDLAMEIRFGVRHFPHSRVELFKNLRNMPYDRKAQRSYDRADMTNTGISFEVDNREGFEVYMAKSDTNKLKNGIKAYLTEWGLIHGVTRPRDINALTTQELNKIMTILKSDFSV